MQRPKMDEYHHLLPRRHWVLSRSKQKQLFRLRKLRKWCIATNRHKRNREVRLLWPPLHDQVMRLCLHLRQPDQLQLQQPWHIHRCILLSSLDRRHVRDEVARKLHEQGIVRGNRGKPGCLERDCLLGTRRGEPEQGSMSRLARKLWKWIWVSTRYSY